MKENVPRFGGERESLSSRDKLLGENLAQRLAREDKVELLSKCFLIQVANATRPRMN